MKNTSQSGVTVSGIKTKDFETVLDGKDVRLYVLSNRKGAEICITNFGGIVVSLVVPDRSGHPVDVVLGYASIEKYLNTPEKYLGALIGRYGNRIKRGEFVLDDKAYKIPSNNPDCALHGGLIGYNNVVWDAVQNDDNSLDLTYVSPDGEEGFPGELTVKVRYTLTDDNEMRIDYEAKTDKATVVNLTHHSFFNLNGDDGGEITNHVVTIHADHFTPMDDKSVPTGEIRKVAGTPMDFNTPHVVGERIDADYEQLRFGRGYDHNYVLNKRWVGEMVLAAKAVSPKTGISMEVYTTEPGVQLYTGNWLNGFLGKEGHCYSERTAICFETQHFPDSPNNPHFPSTVLRPGEKYTQTCIYKFGVEG